VAYEYKTSRRIEFAETDLAGIVHFSNYFRYMEMAEHEFLRSLGLSVHTQIDGCTITWPRVQAECSFQGPLKFEEEVEIRLLVREKTDKTITYDFRFFNRDGKLAASGSITAICVAFNPVTQQMSAMAIPPVIDEKIEAAPADVIESNR